MSSSSRRRGRARASAIVEPNPSDASFERVARLARIALDRGEEVVLLTCKGASTTEAYRTHLGALPLTVLERFGGTHLPEASARAAVRDLQREMAIDGYVLPGSVDLGQAEPRRSARSWVRRTLPASSRNGSATSSIVRGRL
jgi:hypothetical protein